jgi:hypothetical protein
MGDDWGGVKTLKAKKKCEIKGMRGLGESHGRQRKQTLVKQARIMMARFQVKAHGPPPSHSFVDKYSIHPRINRVFASYQIWR